MTILGILKIFILFGILVYLIFAVVVVKQVKIMNATLKTPLEFPVQVSSFIPLAFAVAVFLFALLAL